MKEFMFIFSGPTYEELNLSAEEAQAQMMSWFKWVGDLKSKEQYVDGRPLLPPAKRITGATKRIVTDGPFAESKEVVGGYFVIKAADFDEAVKIAEGFPDYKYQGTLEIREVFDTSALEQN
ncbi:hypothetical protein HHL16_08805 [Pseudoflavitalea sp. G-6-1-2]|uniref:YciI family protein n=1 Tax=Pseudoflavitalea sp. G-6-1-2 TaxID=2728841 RepID=UPI00146B1DC1|nr:YciI family protein [Pseudoflavitalea sp. G-6-1-2]NML20971.1 hypothetical protein [Pseudoflavitalea sp. G-6-1-2]